MRDVATQGNILEASRWPISKPFLGLATFVGGLFKSKAASDNSAAIKGMKDLGKLAADRILKKEKDSGKAAAILLLTALDIAYISVLAVGSSTDICQSVLTRESSPPFSTTCCKERTIMQQNEDLAPAIGLKSRNWL